MSEHDPTGRKPGDPGAKLDAGKIRHTLIQRGFARALEQIAAVGTMGAQKYADDSWLEVPNGIERYTDAEYRHLKDEHTGQMYDPQSGLLHAAHHAWNAVARLELILRQLEMRGEPLKLEPGEPAMMPLAKMCGLPPWEPRIPEGAFPEPEDMRGPFSEAEIKAGRFQDGGSL